MKLSPCVIPKPRATRAVGVVVACLAAVLALSHGSVLAVGEAPSAPRSDTIVFVSARDGNPEIYTVHVDGAGLTRLTHNGAVDEYPAWSPDGQRIAFQSNRTGSYEIYVMNADGSGVVQRTFSHSYSVHPTWSHDGATIAYSTVSNGSANIWKVGASSGTPSLLFSAPGWDDYPDWSTGGAQLALTSDWYAYDFVQDIFLVNLDGSGFTGRTGNIFDQIDYVVPAWAPDGAKLSLAIVQTTGIDQYITNLGVMNEDGSNLRALAPAATWTRSSWSPDGKRIVYTASPAKLVWIKADGSASGIITTNGYNPDWYPVPAITDVAEGELERPVGVRVLTSPSRGPVRFAVEGKDPGDELSIYNVSGRRVDRVPLGTYLSKVVGWDWRQSGCAAGVYFARLSSARGQAVRFVVLP